MNENTETTTSKIGFEGFRSEAFEVYEVPEFSLRMPLLKERITPGLVRIGEALRETLGEILEEPVFPHVAKHLRRTVNPPIETWVAFARAARAYKPFVHTRVAVNHANVRVLVFVEDYADDKLLFADRLAKRSAKLAAHCKLHPEIQAFDIFDKKGAPLSGSKLRSADLKAFSARMHAVKGQHARFGIVFPKTLAMVQNGEELLEAVTEATRTMKPFYDLGK